VGTRTHGITNPTFRAVTVILVVVYAVFLLIIFLRAESDSWAILVVPTLPLLPLAYVLHRGSLTWLRVEKDEIEIIPSWFMRKFWREQNKIARFNPGSELLFCRRFAYGSFDGFFIILRSPFGTDQTLWSTHNSSTGVGRRWWSRIARELSETNQLNTRLVEQTFNSQGTQEREWPSGAGKMLWKGLRILVVPAIAPWLGIGARLLSSDPFKLVGVGIVLWIGTAAWVWYWIRPLRGKLPRRDVTTPVLVFTLEFATFYTLSVLVTGAVLHH